MRTVRNTKSRGRSAAQKMINSGASVESVHATLNAMLGMSVREFPNRHALTGFAEVARRYIRRNMVVRDYAVRLRHDGGSMTLSTAAQSARVARDMILKAENAPERSVVWVRERPCCEYCLEPATRRTRETLEPLCAGCARDQTSGPVREYVTTLRVTQWPVVAVS